MSDVGILETILIEDDTGGTLFLGVFLFVVLARAGPRHRPVVRRPRVHADRGPNFLFLYSRERM